MGLIPFFGEGQRYMGRGEGRWGMYLAVLMDDAELNFGADVKQWKHE
jgi:hypothetical protein